MFSRVYELFLMDSSRVVTRAAREVIANADRHKAHQAWKYNLAVNSRRERATSVVSGSGATGTGTGLAEKGRDSGIVHREVA